MGKSQREKGARVERMVADSLSGALAMPIRRELGQSREGGADLVFPGYVVEVKARASFAATPWMKQAKVAAAALQREPIVAIKSDREDLVALIPWPTLLRLLQLEAEIWKRRETELLR